MKNFLDAWAIIPAPLRWAMYGATIWAIVSRLWSPFFAFVLIVIVLASLSMLASAKGESIGQWLSNAWAVFVDEFTKDEDDDFYSDE